MRRESWGDFRYKNTTHKTTTDPRLGAATSQGTELAVMGERRACNGIRGGRRLEDPPALPLDRRRRPAGAATALRVSRRLVAPTASLRDAAGSMCQMGVGYHVGNPSAQRTANPIPSLPPTSLVAFSGHHPFIGILHREVGIGSPPEEGRAHGGTVAVPHAGQVPCEVRERRIRGLQRPVELLELRPGGGAQGG